MDQLTADEKRILDFEALHWTYPGARDTAIRETFGHSAVRHAQIVLSLIDRAEALAYAPLLVKRMRRLRDARVAARAGR